MIEVQRVACNLIPSGTDANYLYVSGPFAGPQDTRDANAVQRISAKLNRTGDWSPDSLPEFRVMRQVMNNLSQWYTNDFIDGALFDDATAGQFDPPLFVAAGDSLCLAFRIPVVSGDGAPAPSLALAATAIVAYQTVRVFG